MVLCVETHLPDLFLWTELGSFSLRCQHTAGCRLAGTALKSCRQACICVTAGDPRTWNNNGSAFLSSVCQSYPLFCVTVYSRTAQQACRLTRAPTAFFLFVFFCPLQPSEFIFLPFPITTRRSYAAPCARGPASPWRLTNRKTCSPAVCVSGTKRPARKKASARRQRRKRRLASPSGSQKVSSARGRFQRSRTQRT